MRGGLCDRGTLSISPPWKRKGLKASCGCVAEAAFALSYLRPLGSSPYLMRTGVKNPEK